MNKQLDKRLAILEAQIPPSPDCWRIERLINLFDQGHLVNVGTQFITGTNEPVEMHRIAELLNLARMRHDATRV